MAHLIEKLDISLGLLQRLFQAVGCSVVDRSYGGIWVDRDGQRITIELKEKNHTILFQAIAPIKVKWLFNTNSLVSELNSKVSFAKCRVAGEVHKIVFCEHSLSYEAGVLAEQILASYVSFCNAHVEVMSIIKEKGCNNW